MPICVTHYTSCTTFLRDLKQRGLKDVELFISDKCLCLVENLDEIQAFT